jgi:pimeloyl-ACP methyl ester carboxylesterase
VPDTPDPRTVTVDDGVEIAYRHWPGEGLPVVLQHGFVVDTYVNWVATGVVAALLAAGRAVVGVDARGHGRSGRPHDPASYGEARMSRDLRAVVDDLGADAYDLVGYSMGGVVAVLTAAADHRVRRLVVGGVGSAIVELGGVDTRALDRDLLADGLAADDLTTVTDDGSVRAFRQLADAVGADRLALAAQARSVHRGSIDLAAITAPTLVLVGDADPLAARPQVLAAAIAGARLQLLQGNHTTVFGDPGFAPAIAAFVGQGT